MSKLFTVDYNKSAPTLGLIKFNKYNQNLRTQLVPLGGIKLINLNTLKNVKSEGFAILSELKKPVKIINRLLIRSVIIKTLF